MASPQSKVLATAAAEIGYSRWSDPKRGTKYARETQPVFWPRDHWLLANGISYCDIFVTWVFWKALGEDFVTSGALPAGASYNTDYRASKGGRIAKSKARPGDVLVFDWNWSTLSTNHVGILERVLPSGNFQTIEGNTSVGTSGSQSNGGRVARRVRRPGQVRYVIRPQWSKAGGGFASTPASSSSAFADVDKTQAWLKTLGYDPGPLDGKYGTKTAAATRAAQKALGITPVDGRPGPTTRTHLEAAVTTLDKISKDLATIKRALEPGISGKRTDGEHVAQMRKFRNELSTTIPAEVLDAPIRLQGSRAGTTSTLRTKMAWLDHERDRQNAAIAGLSTQLAGLSAAVTALADGGSVDLEAVRAAAAEGARQGGVAVSAEDVAALLAITVAPDDEG